MTEHYKILVTGATGNIGRHVVAQLLDRGAAVRALVRHPGAADLPEGVQTVRGDLTDPASVDRALKGIDTVFLLWPLFSIEAVPAIVDVIANHARRVVFLSSMGAQDGSDARAKGIEDLISRSGLGWTFLRAGGLATNTLGWADEIRADGVVRWPYGGAARSLIHEHDVAAVAVHALLEDGHEGAAYVLTGPEAVTQAEQVRIIGEVAGRPARWEELAPELAREQLVTAWGTFPEWATDHADDFRRLDVEEMAERSMRVRKLTLAEAATWSRVGNQEIFVSDLIDQGTAPAAKMTVGYAHVGKGEALDISFPYDEVLVLITGSYTLRTEHGEVITARPGDVVYLPAGSSSSSYAEEDTEMVYVANPPGVYADHVAASADSQAET